MCEQLGRRAEAIAQGRAKTKPLRERRAGQTQSEPSLRGRRQVHGLAADHMEETQRKKGAATQLGTHESEG